MFHTPSEGKTLIPVKKDELLGVVRKNRENHQRMFEEAVKGYQEEAVEALKRAYEDAKSGKDIRLHFHLEKPQSHSKDYDRMLKALEMTTLTEIHLSDPQFAAWVMDDWAWKEGFIQSTSNYTNKGR